MRLTVAAFTRQNDTITIDFIFVTSPRKPDKCRPAVLVGGVFATKIASVNAS